MESPRLRLLPALAAALLLLPPLLGARAQEDAGLQPRALDLYSAVDDASHEKELVGTPSAAALGPARSLPSCALLPTAPLPPRAQSQGSRRPPRTLPSPGPEGRRAGPLSRLLDLRSVCGTRWSAVPGRSACGAGSLELGLGVSARAGLAAKAATRSGAVCCRSKRCRKSSRSSRVNAFPSTRRSTAKSPW